MNTTLKLEAIVNIFVILNLITINIIINDLNVKSHIHTFGKIKF